MTCRRLIILYWDSEDQSPVLLNAEETNGAFQKRYFFFRHRLNSFARMGASSSYSFFSIMTGRLWEQVAVMASSFLMNLLTSRIDMWMSLRLFSILGENSGGRVPWSHNAEFCAKVLAKILAMSNADEIILVSLMMVREDDAYLYRTLFVIRYITYGNQASVLLLWIWSFSIILWQYLLAVLKVIFFRNIYYV